MNTLHRTWRRLCVVAVILWTVPPGLRYWILPHTRRRYIAAQRLGQPFALHWWFSDSNVQWQLVRSAVYTTLFMLHDSGMLPVGLPLAACLWLPSLFNFAYRIVAGRWFGEGLKGSA